MTGIQEDINSKNRLTVVHGTSNGFIPGAELVYIISTTVADYTLKKCSILKIENN